MVTADGKELGHEEVVKLLDRDTVLYEANPGYGSSFQELFRATVKVEKEKYALGLAWLRDSIFASKFTKDRFVYLRLALPLFKLNLTELVSRLPLPRFSKCYLKASETAILSFLQCRLACCTARPRAIV